MKLCGFQSKHAVTKLVRHLSAEGFLRKDVKGFLLGYYQDLCNFAG
jgi:hypothetical protein